MPESATACNCTMCRRYGALWAFDYEGEGINVSGPTQTYVRGESIGDRFDGLESFEDLPRDGRCVADYWY